MSWLGLRADLLLRLGLPLAALVPFNLWTTRLDAITTADLVQDRTLTAAARVIAERIESNGEVIEATIPPAALEMFVADVPDRVVYRVIGPNGTLLAGYADGPMPTAPPSGLTPLHFSTEFQGRPVRMVALAQPIVTSKGIERGLVVVGSTLANHDRLVSELWSKALRDQVLLVAAACALAAYGLTCGLARLTRLRDRILRRNSERPEPLAETEDLPSEFRPLADALDRAFARIEGDVAIQRRFVANAAHQLRTPLAVLKTQIGVGLKEKAAAQKHEALTAADRSVGAMTRLVNQLLALARAERGEAVRKDTVDLVAVIRSRLDDLALVALARRVDLAFEPAVERLSFRGHETLLGEIVVNLVENALRHAGEGGEVVVAVDLDRDAARIVVEDTGPGIPAGERERVFERFHRLDRSEATGTGLGLSVAREAAAAHGGTIALEPRADGRSGLRAVVRLPTTGGSTRAG
ncbi:MAG: sensor histidine kinase [Phyllobacteriaceae bacterium]|nr:sensor histidine kinase [Phyllobacteriaceae bacterium]